MILMFEDVHAMNHRLIPVNHYDPRQRLVTLATLATVGVFDKYCLYSFTVSAIIRHHSSQSMMQGYNTLAEIPIEDVYHYTVDAPNELVFNFERSKI